MALGLAVLYVLLAGLGTLFADELLTAIYRGESLAYLDGFGRRWRLRNPQRAGLSAFVGEMRPLMVRLFAFSGVVVLATAAVFVFRRRVFTRFFGAKAGPVNLAVFRIVFFALLLRQGAFAGRSFSQLPEALRIPPPGLEWIVPHLPITETTIAVAGALFTAFCITGLLGLFSRTSALMATLLGLYVLGVPQFFGKVNHNHHLIWFGAVLAASRCGDTLSLDALWHAGRYGRPPGPQKARGYALPLRFIWLLIGLVYFFPGFWKFAKEGLEWAFSENLKFRLYKRWFMLGDWQPAFRLDRYPLLYQGGALFTMVFEIGFLFALFWRRTRLAAAGLGLVFHNMTALMMRISFRALQGCYVAFFNWDRIFPWLGETVFEEKLPVRFDPTSRPQQRAVAALRTADVLGRVRYMEATNASTEETAPERALRLDTLWRGSLPERARCCRRLAARLPLLAPLLAFVALAAGAGRKGRTIFARVARAPKPSHRPRWVPVAVVGAGLLAANVASGALLLDSWPFAVYPTFATPPDDDTEVVAVQAVDARGRATEVAVRGERTELGAARLHGVVRHILYRSRPEERRARLRAVWKVWKNVNPELKEAQEVRFYRVRFSTRPERADASPLERTLLAAIHPRE
jgi:hypothetical protein